MTRRLGLSLPRPRQRGRNAKRNTLLSPVINRISQEVLRTILLFVCRDEEERREWCRGYETCSRHSLKRDAWPLALVCHDWHHLIFVDQQKDDFWKTILSLTTHETEWFSIEPGALSKLLSRHPLCDVDIILNDDTKAPHSADLCTTYKLLESLEVIRGAQARWRTLHVYTVTALRFKAVSTGLDFHVARTFERLEFLIAKCSNEIDDSGVECLEPAVGSIFPWSAPKLRKLEIGSIQVDCLSSLILRSDPAITIASSNSQSFTLAWERLNGRLVDVPDKQVVKFTLAKPVSWNSQAAVPFISFPVAPNLPQLTPRDLHLQMDWYWAREVLQRTSCSDLKSLTLELDSACNSSNVSGITSFMERVPDLRALVVLTLQGLDGRTARLISKCTMPNLVELSIAKRYCDSYRRETLHECKDSWPELQAIELPKLSKLHIILDGSSICPFLEAMRAPNLTRLSVIAYSFEGQILNEKITFIPHIEEFIYRRRSTDEWPFRIDASFSRLERLKHLHLRMKPCRQVQVFKALSTIPSSTLPLLEQITVGGVSLTDRLYEEVYQTVDHLKTLGRQLQRIVVPGKLTRAKRVELENLVHTVVNETVDRDMCYR